MAFYDEINPDKAAASCSAISWNAFHEPSDSRQLTSDYLFFRGLRWHDWGLKVVGTLRLKGIITPFGIKMGLGQGCFPIPVRHMPYI